MKSICLSNLVERPVGNYFTDIVALGVRTTDVFELTRWAGIFRSSLF